MKKHDVTRRWAFAAFAVVCGSLCLLNPCTAAEISSAETEGAEVLVRGPVHEGFAQTVTFNPEPGILAPKAPPAAIEELPPDQRPAGDHVEWIPGYWAWDDDRTDYLWVSGIWRAIPPGRQWVPGNWSQAGTGYQWTAGYWADIKANNYEYLPEPPASVEEGPNSGAPSANHIWLPGSWVWNENRYAWQPGYWAEAQQNWMWVPAQYIWSPRGYVYTNGYYDYSVDRRGMLFAPVYFNPSVYGQQGYTYTPSMAINLAVFGSQLFLRPNYNHYYFGDYYGSSYSSAGYYPGFSFNSGRHGYDPIYAQQLWQNREDPSWAKTAESNFRNRVDHDESRPPRTLADQQAALKNGETANDKNLIAAMPIEQAAKSKQNSLKLQPVTKEEQQSFAKHGQAVHEYRDARQKQEAKPADSTAKEPARDSTPTQVKFPKSPIAAKSAHQLGEEHTPPKPHELPHADAKIEPKPRSPAAAKPNAPKPAAPPARPNEKPTPKPEPKPESPKVPPKSEAPKPESSKPPAKPNPK